MIFTDGWSGYHNLNHHGFNHFSVVHKASYTKEYQNHQVISISIKFSEYQQCSHANKLCPVKMPMDADNIIMSCVSIILIALSLIQCFLIIYDIQINLTIILIFIILISVYWKSEI